MPASMISATEPRRKASTGVPHAMASIMTRPNGSGQSTGKRTARASPRKSDLFALVDLPDKLDTGQVEQRHDALAEIGFIDLIHLGRDLQRHTQRLRYLNGPVGSFFR